MAAQPFEAFFIGQLKHDGVPMRDSGGNIDAQMLIARPKVLAALGRATARGDDDDDTRGRLTDHSAVAAAAAHSQPPSRTAVARASTHDSSRSPRAALALAGAFMVALGLTAIPLLRQAGSNSGGSGGKSGAGIGASMGGKSASVAPCFGGSDVGPPVGSGAEIGGYDGEEARALLTGAAQPEASQQHDRFVGVEIGAGGGASGGGGHGEEGTYQGQAV